MYLSLMLSQDEIQLEMYKYMNSDGSSALVVSLFTTSMECRERSMFTSATRYSLACAVPRRRIKHSVATRGLFSTSSGSCEE
jgi:hypothetical protein